ncbi:MAG: NADH-quinone oxidoreductase subunit N [Planctomycetia bacterium]
MTTSLDTFTLLAPELALLAAALVALLGAAFAGLRSGWLVAILGIAAAMALAGGVPASDTAITSGPITLDGFSGSLRWLVLVVGGILALVQSGDLFRSAVTHGSGLSRGGTCEEAGTFLILLAGLSLVGVANDLVLLFVGLELVSIPTYILLALKRTDAAGQEASLKYFFLSLVASALFLYSAVCFYGLGGSTNLQAIGGALRSADPRIAGMATVLLPVALGMAMAGAAFRLAAVPMHFYAPDVYQGTSPGNAALLSTLPKIAGIVVLARVLGLAIQPIGAPGETGPAAQIHLSFLWHLAAILAAITMTVGNVMALVQNNLRRLLACSSIAHAGYLLVGIAAAAAAAGTRAERPFDGAAAADTMWTMGLGGMSATLLYVATYVLATAGVFAAIAYLGHVWPEWSSGSGPRPPREEIAEVDDLDGLSSTNPVAAFSLAVFLLSLAGIPPLPGFWGKLTLATAALEVDWTSPVTLGSRRAWFVALAVILVLNAAIAAAYYLRLVAAMYFKTTKKGVQTDGGLAAGIGMLVCLLLVLVLTARPGRLFAPAIRAGSAATNLLSAGGPSAPVAERGLASTDHRFHEHQP